MRRDAMTTGQGPSQGSAEGGELSVMWPHPKRMNLVLTALSVRDQRGHQWNCLRGMRRGSRNDVPGALIAMVLTRSTGLNPIRNLLLSINA